MTLRRKSAKRLGILAVAAAAAATAAGYTFHRKQLLHEVDLQHIRDDGMAAYASGDYSLAIDKLDRYISEHDTDDQAVLAYAISRAKIETAGGQNLRKSVEKLDQILQRHPDDLAAEHALLEILPQTGDTDRLADLSDDVLSHDPHDAAALAARVTVRMRQDKLDDALAAAREYAAQKPQDLQARITVLHLLTRLQKPAADVQAYADAQFTQPPNDPRRLLLRAIAVSYGGDQTTALSLLQQAAARPLADAGFVEQLANLFDLLHHFDDSRKLLEDAAVATHDPKILNALVLRLWQQGQYDQIVERLASLDPADPKTDPAQIAFRAIGLYQTQHAADANKLLTQLQERKDRKSLAWAEALSARYVDAHLSAEDAEALTRALTRDPDNGVFKTWLAECYAALNEPALALRCWSGASLQMPEWATPYIGISQSLAQLGRYDEATQAAQSAFDRRPSVSTAVNYVQTRYRAIQNRPDPAAARDLLSWIDRIQAASPGESATLPIQIDLLARLGERSKAIALIDQAITRSPRYDDATLLAITRSSRTNDLGNEDRILSVVPIDQTSPPLLLTRATLFADAGDPQRGKMLLQSRAAGAPADQKLAWNLAMAKYLDATHDRQAENAWLTLGDANPAALDIQHAVLASTAAWSNRAFMDRTIDRLKNLTGEQGQQWKLERARWLIESPDINKDCVEAVTLLSDIVRESPKQIAPRLELADALERTGNVNSAIEHLKLAEGIDPANVATTVDLVRMLQEQGRSDQVRDALQRLTAVALLSPAERLQIASLMIDAGDAPHAIALLSADDVPDGLSLTQHLLLAAAYQQAGDIDKAGAIYEQLLADAKPAPAALVDAAEFYARQQQPVRARAALGRLDQSSAAPVEMALAHAHFEERFGDRAAALAQYQRAADTGVAAGYLALIDFQLHSQTLDAALSTTEQAKAAMPNDRDIADRAIEIKALQLEQKDPKNIRPLIEILSQDPSRAAEAETLRTLAGANDGSIAPGDLLAQLRVVADRFPTYLPLQTQLIDTYLKQGRNDDAVSIARRLMDARPTDPTVARLDVTALSATGRWSEALAAADQWKRRATGDTLDPDTAAAEALIQLKRPADALKRMEPYRQQIAAAVRSQPQGAFVIARAMTALGDDAKARELMQPLLQDASGRRMWRSIAANDAPTLASALGWCDQLTAATAADAWEERASLLALRASLGRRFDDTPTLAATIDLANAYLAQRPHDGDVLLLVSGLDQQLGRLPDAETAMRTLLAADPGQPAANNDLACLLMSENRAPDEALHRAQAAVAVAPGVAAFDDTLARAFMGKQQFADARQAFETALRLDPNLVEARIGLAHLLSVQGDPNAARDQLRRAETQVTEDPHAGRAVQDEMSSLHAALSRTDP